VLILPYIMPGFMLAQQVHQATQALDWQSLQGIILLHHGIFTFAEDAKTSYDTMIALVSAAEDYLDQSGARSSIVAGDYQPTSSPAPQTSTQQPSINDHLTLARLRAQASKSIGYPLLLRWQYDPLSVGFSKLDSVAELVSRGPLTPDHSIHTKPFAAVFSADPGPGLQQFCDDYLNYFNQHAQAHHQCLDLLPRVGVWRDRGMVYLAPTVQRLDIVADIYRHTLQAIQWGEALGGWTALPHQDLFDLEYWELEQAKLKTSQQRQPFEGRVVLVTGAASGIGKACVEAFVKVGACVVALDIDSKITAMFAQPQVSGQLCDVTDSAAVQLVIAQTIERFGGLDVLVSNAGFFPRSQTLEFISDEAWEKSLNVNLGAHMRLLRSSIPFLRHGLDPSVVIVGSKNVPAPGPGAAAYSAAKAGLAQLARVAALELAGDGIRVNTIHPDAVFDTALWTAETLAARAASYGISVAEYKNKNLLKTAVSSADVAAMAVLLTGPGFAKTTGAQIAVDGGNERVI
jgi:NAD(P)-dependent dehydrogenase (short-subunit alcohol dehydrogenase family)